MRRSMPWLCCLCSLTAQGDGWARVLAETAAAQPASPAEAQATADRLRSALAGTPNVPIADLQGALVTARRLQEQHLERLALERLLAALPGDAPEAVPVAVELGYLLVDFSELARARTLLTTALRAFGDANTPERWFALACLARVHRVAGDLAAADESGQAALQGLEALGIPQDPRALLAKEIVANIALLQGQAYSVTLLGECVDGRRKHDPSRPASWLSARVDHLRALATFRAPDGPAAERQLVQDCEAWLPQSHLTLQTARCNLAGKLLEQDPAGAWQLVAPVLEELARRGPGVPLWHQARLQAAACHRQLGDPARAHDFATTALALVAGLPAAATRRLEAELEVAECQRARGDLAGALALQLRLAAVLAETPGHPFVGMVAQNLAATFGALGDWQAAAAYAEQALVVQRRASDQARLALTANAAFARFQAGRPHGVRRELEAALAALEKSHGAAALVTRAAEQLATVRLASGDPNGAVAAFTRIHAAIGASPGANDERALMHVAVARAMAGEAASAAGLFAQVLAARESRLGRKDPAVARTRANLALSAVALGRSKEAVALLRQALADLPADHRLDRALLEVELGGLLSAAGDAAAAAALGHTALAALQASGTDAPARWPAAWAAATRALAAAPAGDPSAALAACAPAARRWLAQVHLAPREQVLAAANLQPLADVLAAAVLGTAPFAATPARTGELVLLLESLHGVAVRAARSSRALQASAEPLAVTTLGNDLRGAAAMVTALGVDPALATSEDLRQRLRAAVERRDAIQRQLAELAAPWRGRDPAAVTLADLAAALPARAAAVALRRLRPGHEDVLVAAVLGADGTVRCMPLGPFAAVAAACRELQQQGYHAPAHTTLVTRVLAPVRAALPVGTTEIVLALDGDLQSVPWDALESTDGEPFGAHGCVRVVDSWFELLAQERRQALPEAPALVAFGGIDYGAVSGAAVERGGAGPFPPLVHAEAEVDALAAHWRADLAQATLRTRYGTDASWSALSRLAPEAQVLHLATHGWFQAERVDGVAVRDTARWSAAQLEGFAPQSGLAPFTLCGLALAGANGGEPGLVRGEQLATLDLSHCAVAVLSTCHGGAGFSAGDGLASLREALRAAGARFVVAAPWPVADAVTAALLLDFHRHLWAAPAAQRDPVRALWAARMAARDRQMPWRDWAGWTVVGL